MFAVAQHVVLVEGADDARGLLAQGDDPPVALVLFTSPPSPDSLPGRVFRIAPFASASELSVTYVDVAGQWSNGVATVQQSRRLISHTRAIVPSQASPWRHTESMGLPAIVASFRRTTACLAIPVLACSATEGAPNTESDCGNGLVESGEECDTGGESEACNEDCTQSICGDRKVNASAGEACDDGHKNGSGEGYCLRDCSDTIRCDAGAQEGCLEISASVCGDGVVGKGEVCDDGPSGSETCSGFCQLPWIWVSPGGDRFACGVDGNRKLQCWGQDDDAEVTEPPEGQFRQVTSGLLHACAIKEDGTVLCWGEARMGNQLDAPAGTFVSIEAGEYFTCGLRSDQTIECWGDPTFSKTDAPEGTFTELRVGSQHACALRADGTVACWGRGSRSDECPDECGQSQTPDGVFTSLGAGVVRTCGIRPEGNIECWSKRKVDVPSGAFESVLVGYVFICGVDSEGRVTCENDEVAPPSERFVQLDGAGRNICGITIDGRPLCWGRDSLDLPR